MLKEVVMKLYEKVSPELKIDHASKIVEIRDRYFFSNLTEAYYVFKGYEVQRV